MGRGTQKEGVGEAPEGAGKRVRTGAEHGPTPTVHVSTCRVSTQRNGAPCTFKLEVNEKTRLRAGLFLPFAMLTRSSERKQEPQ